jgi:hypothetical protein
VLRAEGPRTALTDDELQPFVDRLAKEFACARSVLDDKIPAYHEIPKDQLEQYLDWREFRRLRAADLPADYADPVWLRAFNEVRDQRSTAHAEWNKQHPKPPKSYIERMSELASSTEREFLRVSPLSFGAPPTDYGAIWARRHDELRSERDRTQQQLEDVQGEVRRLEQARDAIVKPDGRLWQGIAVLILFSVIGVIAPLWALSRTPTDFTPHLRLLFWGFSVVFGLLVAYFVTYAWRLTRKTGSARR